MSRQKPASFTPYFRVEDAEQVRAAFLAAGRAEGYESVSDLIEAAVLREVRRLQRKHNKGRKWEPVKAGALRPGRRTLTEEGRQAP
ncbi:ParB family protein [Arthrobacter sp. G119Y2]|uniref:ParB family protein n=1 Tax=Arthrobacter sp. G119Y2 TaxID=3134965 RepID=UPI003119CD33